MTCAPPRSLALAQTFGAESGKRSGAGGEGGHSASILARVIKPRETFSGRAIEDRRHSPFDGTSRALPGFARRGGERHATCELESSSSLELEPPTRPPMAPVSYE